MSFAAMKQNCIFELMIKRFSNQGLIYLLLLGGIIALIVYQYQSKNRFKMSRQAIEEPVEPITFKDTIRLKDSRDVLVLRTDFTDQLAWNSLKLQLTASYEQGFRAYLEFMDDPKFEQLQTKVFKTSFPKNYKHSLIFLVDSLSLFNPEHPVICVDLGDHPGRYFRVTPAKMWEVENNLSTANMYFDEFYDLRSRDGIYH